MSLKLASCPKCGAPASAELLLTWTIRCSLSCTGSPEAEAFQRPSAELDWNRQAREIRAGKKNDDMIWLAIITVYLAAGAVLAACMRESDRQHKLEASRHASKYIGVILLWPFAVIMFVGTSLFESMDRFMEPRALRQERINDNEVEAERKGKKE